MEHWEKKANGWVFLSHSSHDYEDVKIVRNYLEESGFSALMFYLKCLEDEDKKDRAQQLIEWEIESRNIFVLCDSKQARRSPWVELEVDHVKQFPQKIYKTIDIDRLKYEKCTQLSKLDTLMKSATLFFSYVQEDAQTVERVYNYLVSNGFKIFYDKDSFESGLSYDAQLYDALEEVAKNGLFLMFLSHNARTSKWFWDEKSLALHAEAKIISIILDDVDIERFPALTHRPVLDITQGDFSANMHKLLTMIHQENRSE
jgi:hypothetical protein